MPPARTLRFDLPYRPPYDWERLLAFLARRTIDGVEVVDDGTYARTMRAAVGPSIVRGWARVSRLPDTDALGVDLSASLAPALPAVRDRLARLFDVALNPAEMTSHLGALAARTPGLRLPGTVDGFELAVRAVLGQQVTVKAAHTVAGRFARAFGSALALAAPAGLDTVFPAPGDIAGRDIAEIASLGIVRVRAGAILALADALANGRLHLEPGQDVPAQLAQLRAVPGIGEWTAQYMAMRALRWPDAFPHTDYGVRKALGTTVDREVLARAEAWRPWRAYAVMHLWRSLAEASG